MNTPVSHRPRPASSIGGFTLVELLTVIAIVGVLAAVIIPVVGKVRASARASADLANMRQLGKSMLLYAGENKGAINIVATLAPLDTWGNNYWTRAAPFLGSGLASENFGTNTVQSLS